MPLAADPNRRFNVVMESDKDTSPQPVFFVRYVTMRQWPDVMALYDATFDKNDKDPKSIRDKISAALEPLLRGWENVPDPDDTSEKPRMLAFDFSRVQDVLDMQEGRELLDKAMLQRPQFEDKKKLESPSPLPGANHAVDAPGRPNAAISPP